MGHRIDLVEGPHRTVVEPIFLRPLFFNGKGRAVFRHEVALALAPDEAVSSESLARHERKTLSATYPDLLSLIEPSLGVIDAMTGQIRLLEISIEAMAYPECEYLTQIAETEILVPRLRGKA